MRNVSRTALCGLLLFLASVSVYAQDAPESVKQKFLKEPTPAVRTDAKRGLWRSYGKAFKVSMAVCVGGGLADTFSTNGLVETNPLFRRSDGSLNKGTAILSTGLVCGGTVLLEKKWPRFASVGRFVFGAVRFGFAVNNWRK